MAQCAIVYHRTEYVLFLLRNQQRGKSPGGERGNTRRSLSNKKHDRERERREKEEREEREREREKEEEKVKSP